MLMHCIITQNSRAEGRFGGVVLNTKFITELVEQAGGTSRFYYFPQSENRRGGRLQLTVTQTVAQIRAAMNTANATDALILAVFPDEDITQATVWTTFNIDEVIMAWPAANRLHTYVEINQKGSGVKRYLVDSYYRELEMLAETASTSTSTTT
jgi:hypothetical protein